MRRLLAIAIFAVLALLAVPACGGDDDEADQSAGGTTTEAETTTEATTTEVTTTTTAEPSGPVNVRITYRDGKLSGDTGTVKVSRGEKVQLIVRADIEDEVHLHGYDLAAEVAPGHPGKINFDADQQGKFIAELEHLHLHIVTLRVTG